MSELFIGMLSGAGIALFSVFTSYWVFSRQESNRRAMAEIADRVLEKISPTPASSGATWNPPTWSPAPRAVRMGPLPPIGAPNINPLPPIGAPNINPLLQPTTSPSQNSQGVSYGP